MKYLFLAYGDKRQWEAMSEAEREALTSACATNDEALRLLGYLLDVQRLERGCAVTVRVHHGEVSLAEGSLAQGQEQLRGVFTISARSESGHPTGHHYAAGPRRADRGAAAVGDRKVTAMCRNIRPLFNFDPPATDDEIQAAALQFVRKVSGFNAPSKANEAAFHAAVAEITAAAQKLLGALETSAPPKDRADEAAKARARSAHRFGR